MSRWPRGLDAAYLEHETQQRLERVLALRPHPRRLTARISFEGREYIVTPKGAMARVDGGDPGDEQLDV